MPHQRKAAPNCFQQETYNFSHKKMRAEEAKVKGPAVSHRGNQGLNVPNKHVCFCVAFLNSFSKKGRTELLWTRVQQFLPQRKTEESKAKGPAASDKRIHYLK